MDDGENSEHEGSGFSAGRMVMLFLAGAAVCAVFFSAGFIVGYNEKSSNATPLTEKVTGPSDVPPFVADDSSNPSTETIGNGSKGQKASGSDSQVEPLRPRPAGSTVEQPSDAHARLDLEPKMPPAVMPLRPAGNGGVSATPARAAVADEAGAGFVIQVAATGTKPDADKMVSALKSLNYPVHLVSPNQAHAGDNLYRVQVGPFATRESAEKAKARLTHDGFKQPFIKH